MKKIWFLFLVYGLFAAPPREIPPELWPQFTRNGSIGVTSYYLDDSYPPEKPLVYTFPLIEEFKLRAQRRQEGYYGLTDRYLYAALDQFPSAIQGKKVGIIGSSIPWYEAIVLAYGGKPVAIDYNRIVSEHPDVRTMTVEEYKKNPEVFDALLSISSIEHDGLGRYGDPVDPEGDFRAMQKMKQMVRPGGLLFLAVPVGLDHLFWNAHRVYGVQRLPLLLKGWRVVNAFGASPGDFFRLVDTHQPVFVLQNE